VINCYTRCLLAISGFAFVSFDITEARADEPEALASTPADKVDAPSAEKASPPRGFGSNGSVVLDALLGFGFYGPGPRGALAPLVTGWIGYHNYKYENQGVSGRFSSLTLAPSLDVFVSQHLSLGGTVSAFHSRTRGYESVTVLGGGLRPRIGWVMPITDDLAFWPRAFASIAYSHSSREGAGAVGLGSLGGIAGPAKTKDGSVEWGFGVDAIMAATLNKTVAFTFGPTISYGRLDTSSGSSPLVARHTTTVSAAFHGGIALVF